MKEQNWVLYCEKSIKNQKKPKFTFVQKFYLIYLFVFLFRLCLIFYFYYKITD